MNKNFKKALKFVLKWEGGFADDPDDKGGATNKGITQNTYNAWLKSQNKTLKSVRDITNEEVERIYYSRYWLAAGCNKMSEKFAILSFDTAVNMGVSRVQEFLRAAQWTSIDKFILAREQKYREIAKYGNNKKFLQGWLNRLNDLKTYIEN